MTNIRDAEIRLGEVERDVQFLKEGMGRIEGQLGTIVTAVGNIGSEREKALKEALQEQRQRRPTWVAIVSAVGASVAILVALGNLVLGMINMTNEPLRREIVTLNTFDTRMQVEASGVTKSLALLDQKAASNDVRLAELEGFRRWYFIDRNIPGENARRDALIDDTRKELERLRSR
jgi:hypothetical protein